MSKKRHPDDSLDHVIVAFLEKDDYDMGYTVEDITEREAEIG